MPDAADTLDTALRDLGVDESELAGLSASEREVLLQVLREQSQHGASGTLDAMWHADYTERPVGIDEFITQDRYFGKSLRGSVYPRWVEEMRAIVARDSYEVVFTGCLGAGKTFVAAALIGYDIYRVSCLRDPQRYLGLAPGTPIVYGLYSVFKYKVDTTSYAYLRAFLDNSQYFREHCALNPKLKSAIEFPGKNISVISGSSELHAIGENLYSVLIDEANFMRESKRKAGSSDDVRSQAMQLHNATRARMENRFRRPGRIYLVSSKKYAGSYTTNYIRQARSNPRVHICDFALWDVKPAVYYGGEGAIRWFRVVVGDAARRSRILGPAEADPVDARVVKVPEKHRDIFERDVEAGLRDFAGVETVGTRPLIWQRERVFECVDKDRPNPLRTDVVRIGLSQPTQIEDSLDHAALFRVVNSQFIPRVNPATPRFAHIDLGLNSDHAGFAMGHVSGEREVVRTLPDGAVIREWAPVVYIDMAIRIGTFVGDEIDFSKIRRFIGALATYGFAFQCITFDSWQSVDSQQILKSTGYNTDKLSMDKTDEPYVTLRQTIVDGRLLLPYYEPFLEEVVNLEHDRNARRVDHPVSMSNLKGEHVRGSKDVADAVCAVVWHCSRTEVKVQPTGGLVVDRKRLYDRPAQAQPGRDPEDLRWTLGDYPDRNRINDQDLP